MKQLKTKEKLIKLLDKKILVLDGAMGTMIQKYNLDESQYRGQQFKNEKIDQKGNNEILNITQPQIIKEIHEKYVEAGSNIIETNTFNANSISMDDFGIKEYSKELNKNAALIANQVKNRYNKDNHPVFVAGVIGPTNKSASISPKVDDPGYRETDFDKLCDSYSEQLSGLLEGGVDIILVETVFDSISARAALRTISDVFSNSEQMIPVMISFTINDAGGRMLTGQSIRAFFTSIADLPVFSVGMNCAFGAEKLLPFVEELHKISPYYLSSHPNAGLPNELGEYDQKPAEMAAQIEKFLEKGIVNIIGGCCGTEPKHIVEIAKKAAQYKPRVLPEKKKQTVFSGLEAFNLNEIDSYLKIGERTNVMGSRKFLRHIKNDEYQQALEIAKDQIEKGAHMLNVNMDEGMIDGVAAMKRFLRLYASEPDLAKHPVMVDSSDFNVLKTGIKNLPGKSLVNSISLKEGEKDFLEKAELIKKLGAAVVVMAFDEDGQAANYKRKIEICKRSYDLLTQKLDFPPENIVMDPNVLTIGTGIEDHNNYAVDFLNACRWIKENLPFALVSAGVSNVSFAFRGDSTIRNSMNSVFLHLAIKEGLDMAIISPSNIIDYNDIPEKLRNAVEDVILNKSPNATENLLSLKGLFEKQKKSITKEQNLWENKNPEERLVMALTKGSSKYLNEDLEKLRKNYQNPLDIVEGPLMNGMQVVGGYFEKGEMFLPQVVKAARVMKEAVEMLSPYIEQNNKKLKDNRKGKVLLATVKGDVHDIGKNIISLVLSCNNYQIVDLGVMIDNETIVNAIEEEKPDIVGVSGLITPSLNYMTKLASDMEEKGLDTPLILGGATTSEKHTAVKVAPLYSGPVFHGGDASKSAYLINQLMSSNRNKTIKENIEKQENIRDVYFNKRKESNKTIKSFSLNEARERALKIDFKKHKPQKPKYQGVKIIDDISLKEIEPYIEWKMFFNAMGMKGKFPQILEQNDREGEQAVKLFKEASEILNDILENKLVKAKAVVGIFPAASDKDDIIIYKDEDRNKKETVLHMLRQQNGNHEKDSFCSVSDYIAPAGSGIKDYIGFFGASVGLGAEKKIKEYKKEGDVYGSILFRLICDRLTEAFSELLHYKIRNEYWGYSEDEKPHKERFLKQKYQGIRPAPGYPTCPDHSLKEEIFNLLDIEKNIGIKLTETYAMHPASSVCGCYFAHPNAKYFNLGKISKDQIKDYAIRKKVNPDHVEGFFKENLDYTVK